MEELKKYFTQDCHEYGNIEGSHYHGVQVYLASDVDEREKEYKAEIEQLKAEVGRLKYRENFYLERWCKGKVEKTEAKLKIAVDALCAIGSAQTITPCTKARKTLGEIAKDEPLFTVPLKGKGAKENPHLPDGYKASLSQWILDHEQRMHQSPDDLVCYLCGEPYPCDDARHGSGFMTRREKNEVEARARP